MKKHKYLFILTGITLIMIGLLAIIGCAKNIDESKIKNNKVLSTDQDLVSFSVIASANILNDSSKQMLSQTHNEYNKLYLNGSQAVEPDMDKVNTYLHMMETLFTDGGPILIKEETSDKEGYAIKQVFEVADLSNNKTQYVIYMNESLSDKEYDEVEYNINGIAIIDNVEYTIKGSKEIEDGESELEIRITLDKNNYIIIEQEQEYDEQEYSYAIIKDGKMFSTISFEAELNEETTIKISTKENSVKETYKFIKENNKIKIEHTTGSTKYTIFVTTKVNDIGEIVYEYKVKETQKNYNYHK